MAAGLLGIAGGAGGAEVKIAVVNAGRVMKEYYKTEQADAHIQEQAEEYSAEQDKLMVEYRKLKQEFESLRTETQNKALSEEARDKKKEAAENKLSEVMEYENTIRENTGNRRKQLEDEGRRLHKKLVNEIQDAVRSVAEKGGYGLVLDATGLVASGFPEVLYHDPKMEITDQVLTILNASRPQGAETERAKPAAVPKPPLLNLENP